MATSTREISSKSILCVGLVCIDTVWVCDEYPKEDTDKRCIDQRWQRGGNASNSCTALAALGQPCEFFGTLAQSHELGFLQNDFKHDNISIDHCIYHQNTSCPMSVAIINQQNGSRTLLHTNKSLPELTAEDFRISIDLKSGSYKWIHFEGRPTTDEIKQMLAEVDQYNKTVPADQRIQTSVELEKIRQNLEELQDKADYVFVSKEYAISRGFHNKEQTVIGIASHCRPQATVICAWGEDGAAACQKDRPTVTSPIFPPDQLVDTLGAGDTFNASTIFALNQGKSLQDAITFGCRVAGAKCGMQGFEGLKKFREILS